MKKLLLAGAIAAVASTPAFAQSGNSLVYNLDAEVSTICGVYNFNGQSVDVDFGDLANVDSGTFVEENTPGSSAGYRCNDSDGFTRTISSANNGLLVRSGTTGGPGNEIVFEMKHSGGSGLSFPYQQLTANRVDTFGGSTAFLNGQGGNPQFRVQGVQAAPGPNEAPGTTVFAGDYTDIVTIAVTAN